MTALSADATRLARAGRTAVHVARAGQLIGLIAIADAVPPTLKATIAKLQKRGVKRAMMTGDNQATAERIGKDFGIEIELAVVAVNALMLKCTKLAGIKWAGSPGAPTTGSKPVAEASA